MAKKALMAVLLISFLIDAFLSVSGFVAPAWVLSQFRVGVTPDTLFLAHVIAWMIVLLDLLAGWAWIQVKRGAPVGWTLSYLLGNWWIGIGLSIFVFFGRPDNLVLDSAKGALIVILARLSHPKRTV